jgi:hypothetical protein
MNKYKRMNKYIPAQRAEKRQTLITNTARYGKIKEILYMQQKHQALLQAI